jgi:hypothetical protein
MTGMTSSADTSPKSLSWLTLGALEDLGYKVNYQQADSFKIPVPLRSSERQTEEVQIDQGEDRSLSLWKEEILQFRVVTVTGRAKNT